MENALREMYLRAQENSYKILINPYGRPGHLLRVIYIKKQDVDGFERVRFQYGKRKFETGPK